MANARNKLEFFKIGLFLGAIFGAVILGTMLGVFGWPVVDALGLAVLAGLAGVLVGCAITLFLAAFKQNAASRHDLK